MRGISCTLTLQLFSVFIWKIGVFLFETSVQWRSQPKNLEGAKCLILGE